MVPFPPIVTGSAIVTGRAFATGGAIARTALTTGYAIVQAPVVPPVVP